VAETSPLACDELVVIVTDYLEGAMSPGERARFDAHLDDCPDCVVYVDQFRRTLEAIGTLREDDVPAPARDVLLSAFRDWRRDTDGGGSAP
jgi:anti-sigma factor RsiW